MRGFSVTWVPGSDHAGIATQTVVEKYLKRVKGLDRQQLGRKKFVEEVEKWKDEKGNIIFQQLEKMGAILDWDRTCYTMSEAGLIRPSGLDWDAFFSFLFGQVHTEAVHTAFKALFDRKLIFRDRRLVNWSYSLQSAISDVEVDYMSVEKRTKISVPGFAKPVEFGLIYDIAYRLQGTDSLFR